jgi:hypothetical protein
MPNWCRNEVRIDGRAERVRELLVFAKGEDGTEALFDFNRFAPYPPEWREMDRKNAAWWEQPDLSTEPPPSAYSRWGFAWCVENWGTNSNAQNATIDRMTEEDGTLTACISFDTAWSEPRPLILKASELFPDLEFELLYFEPLEDFTGTFRCKAGTETFSEWGECQHTTVEG